MRLLIGGDFAPTKANFDLFEKGDAEALYGRELLDYLASFDYRLFDLETVIEGAGSVIPKHGPIITTPERCMPGVEAIHPDLFVLANNHTINLGPEGIEHTRQVLTDHGIASVGAGPNIAEARKPFYLTVDDLTIGFYACAEHEFNAADEHTAGVNRPLTVVGNDCTTVERVSAAFNHVVLPEAGVYERALRQALFNL